MLMIWNEMLNIYTWMFSCILYTALENVIRHLFVVYKMLIQLEFEF